MEEFSNNNPEAALRLASPIKSLSNSMKNYRGKLTGMKRLNLFENRKHKEEKLQNSIPIDNDRREILNNVLESVEKVYQEKSLYARSELSITNILRFCTPLKNAQIIYKAAENRAKPDIERESDYMDRNIARTERRLFIGLKSYYPPSEKIILERLFKQALDFTDDQKIEALEEIVQNEGIDQFIDNFYQTTELANEAFLKESLTLSLDDVKKLNDPAIRLILSLNPLLQENRERSRKQSGTLNKLHPKLIEFQKEYYKSDFIPDANGTFRLTFGYIRGYYPKDATYCSPITTFAGVLEKTTGKVPFITPPDLIELHKQKKFGQFFNQKLNDIPVAILYNTDTTGGNSGSPVLNARGQLVGINFDRAWEATINDYAWNEAYSRSIAVDIRYVLWITQKFAGADYLLEEMNIPLE